MAAFWLLEYCPQSAALHLTVQPLSVQKHSLPLQRESEVLFFPSSAGLKQHLPQIAPKCRVWLLPEWNLSFGQ